jgi:hypothetical protein
MRRGQGATGSAGYSVWGAKSPGWTRKGSERSERGGGDRVPGVQRVTALGRKVTSVGARKGSERSERGGGDGVPTGFSGLQRFGAKVTTVRRYWGEGGGGKGGWGGEAG